MRCDQAAIFCGGRGERLRPLTDSVPKPMVAVNGFPFLHHLLLQLKDNGLKRVVLMTGYLGEQIREYFHDGRSLGMDIAYSHGPLEWETGRRLWEARGLLEDHFLLLYGDNFVPYHHKRHLDFSQRQNKAICFIVQKKNKGNIRMKSDGCTVDVYDKTRSAEGLDFVELGYMVTNREIFGSYESPDVSFSDIIKKLVSRGGVAGRHVQDAYYSISDMDRLKLMEKYLSAKKILLIDRDGVINQKAPRGEYVRRWQDFHFVEKNIQGMEELARLGFSFIVISNQAGVARGVMTLQDVEDIHRCMKEKLKERGIRIPGIYVCPHHWDEKCFCRKPSPGLFFCASKDHVLRLDKTFYIGDDPRDCQAAEQAGCACLFIGDQQELTALTQTEKPCLVVPDLKSAVPTLKNHDYFKNAF